MPAAALPARHLLSGTLSVLIVALGLEHTVANMLLVPLGAEFLTGHAGFLTRDPLQLALLWGHVDGQRLKQRCRWEVPFGSPSVVFWPLRLLGKVTAC